jgi:hypothetical protein
MLVWIMFSILIVVFTWWWLYIDFIGMRKMMKLNYVSQIELPSKLSIYMEPAIANIRELNYKIHELEQRLVLLESVKETK